MYVMTSDLSNFVNIVSSETYFSIIRNLLVIVIRNPLVISV